MKCNSLGGKGFQRKHLMPLLTEMVAGKDGDIINCERIPLLVGGMDNMADF